MNRKQLGIILGAAAVGGTAAAILLANRKDGEAEPKAAAPAAKKEIKNARTGTYSFISGHKTVATVDACMKYDAEKFGFDVISEDFPAASGDSHVAVFSGEDYLIQMEYETYYPGESFKDLKKHLTEKGLAFTEAGFGGKEGIRAFEGDSVIYRLPVDEASCLLITVIKGKNCDMSLQEIAEDAELLAMLDSITFA